MGKRPLPGLGLTAYFGDGADEWGDDMDANIRTLSVMTQLRVESRTTPLPESPNAPLVYIIPTGEPDAGHISFYDDGAWRTVAPESGFTAFVKDETNTVYFNGTEWVDLTSANVNKEPIMILAMGASNMYSTVAASEPVEYPANLSVWNWNNVTGSTGTAFVAPDPSTSRLAQAFAVEIARDNPQREVRLVTIAWGAGQISSFSRNTPQPYGTAIARNAAAAIAAAPGAKMYDYTLWWNGESDAEPNRATYRQELETLYDTLAQNDWYDRCRTKNIVFGIVDAPRAPWRNHGQLNYINKQMCAASGGSHLYVPCGQLNNARFWQADIGGVVSPLLNELGIASMGRLAHNSTMGNVTFAAITHADNLVAGVMEVFAGTMYPQLPNIGAPTPTFPHDFQSTLTAYAHAYSNANVIIGGTTAGEAAYNRRNHYMTRIGHMYFAQLSMEWSGHTGEGLARIPNFLPDDFQNNTGADILFAVNAIGFQSTKPVYAVWRLWSRDIEIMQQGDGGVLESLNIPAAGTVSFSLQAYRS